MAFPYYNRLSAKQKAIYRDSDRVGEIRLSDARALSPAVETLRHSLAEDRRRDVAAAVQSLSQALLDQLRVPPLTVKVLAVRPSRGWGELHGLYTSGEERPAEIRLWMRTARHRRVVAFRTFLRTLLHEICHHLDYHALKLGDSFHTEGFFRRESSLFRQLVPDSPGESVRPRAPKPRPERPGARPPEPAPPKPDAVRTKTPSAAEEDRQGRLPFGPDETG